MNARSGTSSLNNTTGPGPDHAMDVPIQPRESHSRSGADVASNPAAQQQHQSVAATSRQPRARVE